VMGLDEIFVGGNGEPFEIRGHAKGKIKLIMEAGNLERGTSGDWVG